MGYLVLGYLFINNIVGTILKKVDERALILISFLILWFIIGWNFQNPDYNNYLIMFRNIQNSNGFLFEGKDFGYKFLMNLVSFFGANYQLFVIIITLIGLILIVVTIKRFSQNSLYVLLLYTIFPFLIDVVQIRNFLMSAIIIFSVRFLISEKKYSLLKYLFLNLLAISIHSVAVIYLPLILIKSKSKNPLKIFVVFCLFLIPFIWLNNNNIPFITNIISLFTDNDLIFYWFRNSTNFGFLVPLTIHILLFSLMLFSKKILKLNNKLVSQKDMKIFNTIYLINLISLAYIVFYMVNIEFIRVLRNLLILNYISFTIVNKSFYTKNSRLKLLYNSLIITYVLFLFSIQILIPHLDSIIRQVLENNLLWK